MSVKSRALRMAVRGRRIGRSPATKALAAVAAQLGLVGGVSYGTGRFFGRRRAMHGKGDPESGGQIALGAITNPLVALGRRHGYN